MPEEQHGIAICKGPCAEPTLHMVIRPIISGRLFLKCRACGTTHNIPKPPQERQS